MHAHSKPYFDEAQSIKEYILGLERIFFNTTSDSKVASVARIRVDSGFYDRHYEKKIRNPNLDILFFLHKLNEEDEVSSWSYLVDAEEYFCSADFYRAILFESNSNHMSHKIESATQWLKKELHAFNACVDDDLYMHKREQYAFLKLPSDRNTFINSAKNILKILSEKIIS